MLCVSHPRRSVYANSTPTAQSRHRSLLWSEKDSMKCKRKVIEPFEMDPGGWLLFAFLVFWGVIPIRSSSGASCVPCSHVTTANGSACMTMIETVLFQRQPGTKLHYNRFTRALHDRPEAPRTHPHPTDVVRSF